MPTSSGESIGDCAHALTASVALASSHYSPLLAAGSIAPLVSIHKLYSELMAFGSNSNCLSSVFVLVLSLQSCVFVIKREY